MHRESSAYILAITSQDVHDSGRRMFFDALSGVTGIVGADEVMDRLRQPVRVAVSGRPGVGCRTVSSALLRAGVDVVSTAPDIEVRVFTEALKPEDRDALVDPRRPRLAVLNKADLVGFGGGAPLAVATARCQELQRQHRVAIRPIASLAAIPHIDDAMLDALRVLVTEPADLGSTDRFVEGSHPLPPDIRIRLLAELDIYGIAHAVSALRRGGNRPEAVAALRQASGIAGVLTALEETAAPVHYRRIVAAMRRLGAIVGTDQILSGDEFVLARMTAAEDALRAAGMGIQRAQGQQGFLESAIVWQRNAKGFRSPLYRMCAADLVRGYLRLWSRT